MRTTLLLIFAALTAAACSASPASVTPSVSIDSVDVSGSHVSVIVEAAGGDSVLLSIEWGDGTSEPEVQGLGTFAFEHTYAGDVTAATISATAAASDGAVASDVAAVELAGNASTTTLTALGTTTTSSVETTTTVPETTTTTVAETTTTSTSTSTTTTTPPTTTTSSTTTTTLLEAVEVELDISKGIVFDQWGSGVQEATWNGSTATATVTRHKDEWESDGIAVSFLIPESSYEDLKAGSTSLTFEWVVYPLGDFRLQTDKTDGNAAQVKWEFMGAFDTTWTGAAYFKELKAGFLSDGKNGTPFEGSWDLAPASYSAPMKIHMFFQCRAKGPGGILVTSDSHCDASLKVNGIVVSIVANR